MEGAVLEVDVAEPVGVDRWVDEGTPHLLIVPASAWVSPDAAVALAPALAEAGVGAAVGTTVVHGVIDLLGSEGFLLDVDARTDLALRLDAKRAAPPLDGPILIDKQALRRASEG